MYCVCVCARVSVCVCVWCVVCVRVCVHINSFIASLLVRFQSPLWIGCMENPNSGEWKWSPMPEAYSISLRPHNTTIKYYYIYIANAFEILMFIYRKRHTFYLSTNVYYYH